MKSAHPEPAILVVEDDAVQRRVMAELLTLYGCRVDVASDTYRAAALLDRRGYDVVMTDVQLPGHGLSTLDHAHRSQPATPVILLTSLRHPTLRRRAHESGAFEVLEKPLTGPELRAAVQRALDSRGDRNRGQRPGTAPDSLRGSAA
jgi:CheY-like chemotaxis protein